MKELTTIITLQLTSVCNLNDEQIDRWEQRKKKSLECIMDAIKEGFCLDDVTLLSCQDFIMDKSKETK